MKKYTFIIPVMAIGLMLTAFSVTPIYASYDLNGDGFVTQEEMEQWANNQGVNGIKGLAELWNSPEYIETYGGGKSTSSSSTQDSNKKEEHTHSYTATVTKEPTCTEAGEMTYKCSCGDSYTEVIAMKPHDYESSVTKKPTCSEEGRNVRYCTICGEAVETMIVDKLPHTEGEWEIIQKPTLTKTGLKVVKCTECGEVLKEETIPANTTLLKIIIGISGGAAIIVLIVGIVEDTILLYIIIRLSAAGIITLVVGIVEWKL